MIPGNILTFLEDRGTVAVSGTRNAEHIPQFHYVSGWVVEPDEQTMRCSIPEAYTDDLISSLENNGQYALTIEQIGPHETYQFKGKYVDALPPNDADIDAFERIRERFVKNVSPLFGFPEEVCRAYIAPPGIIVRFVVHEIFLQTPGPGAGHRLVPPEVT